MHTKLTRLLTLTATLTLALCASTLHAQTPTTLTVTNIFAAPDTYVGKQVTIEGTATWVCPHMGCKAQLTDTADGATKTPILVTQGKGMPKFTPELKGDTLRVTGTLREKRITAADLDEQENEIKNPDATAHAHGDGHDHAKGGDDCANCPDKQKPADPAQLAKAKEAQLKRIAHYRALLAKSKKGYLSSLSFEGQSWTKAE